MRPLLRHPVARASLLAFALLSGCVSVSPRFSQNVQTSFARDDMRKLTTRSLDLYYPAHQRPAALRVAARLERCFETLRTVGQRMPERERGVVYLTSADFNNAYVVSDSSSVPQQMVMPQHMSLELFHFFNLGIGEIGDVGCHEAVHYVQMQQESGLWRALNLVSGGLFQPNIFTESWFLEGLAVHYEGMLNRSGRPNSPIWRGWFEAVAESREGHLDPGHLSSAHRELEPFGGNYLTGSHFVAYLARTYGEKKLWDLVEKQGNSVFSPFGVTLRFKSIYGKSVGALFDDFVATLGDAKRPRLRPREQQVHIEDVGNFARMATARDGTLALVTVSRDDPPRITVRERDGAVRFSERIVQILPERRWLGANPTLASGLSFTADGKWLFLTMVDVDKLGSNVSRLWKMDARDGSVVQFWENLTGLGGSVTPDGTGYVFASVTADTTNLVRLDLRTGNREALTHFTARKSLGAPAISPDGERIAFPEWNGDGFDLTVRDADGSLRRLTRDGRFNYSPRWLDTSRIVFIREEDGRAQAFVADADSGSLTQLTDAPHVVMDPAPFGNDAVALLNRDGLHFSIDTVPLPARGPAQTAAVEPESLPPEDRQWLEPLEIVADEAYSPTEHLFRPELRAPYLYALGETLEDGTTRTRVLAGLGLAGQDRLGKHQYALLFSIDSVDREPNVSFSYANAQLAPVSLTASATRVADADHRDLLFSLGASRTLWTSPVALRFIALQRDNVATETTGALRRRIAGPQIGWSYGAAESTSYGGPQRGLALSATAAYYPEALGDSRGGSLREVMNFGDARFSADTYLPGLPFLSRDNLQLTVRGRFLPGARTDLLQVGGNANYLFGYQSASDLGDRSGSPLFLPSGIAFGEALRGYEDFAIRARNAVIASGRYRQRFILDHGWASTLYLLPSFFLRQFELEGFGEFARTDWNTSHRAAGGAAHLRASIGGLPVSLSYQFARRFDHGLGDLHLVGVSFE